MGKKGKKIKNARETKVELGSSPNDHLRSYNQAQMIYSYGFLRSWCQAINNPRPAYILSFSSNSFFGPTLIAKSTRGTQVGSVLCVSYGFASNGEPSNILYSNMIPFHWVNCTSRTNETVAEELCPYRYLKETFVDNIDTRSSTFGKCYEIKIPEDVVGIEWFRQQADVTLNGKPIEYIFLFFFDSHDGLWYPFTINNTDLDEDVKAKDMNEFVEYDGISIEDFLLTLKLFGEELLRRHQEIFNVVGDQEMVDEFPPLGS